MVTKGEPIEDDDASGLEEFYYAVSNCLISLESLRYDSDLFRSDTLCQTIRRLPQRLLDKWSEHSLSIRSKGLEELNLYQFEIWLQKRVLPRKEVDLPKTKIQKQKEPPEKKAHCNVTKKMKSPTPILTPCYLCEGTPSGSVNPTKYFGTLRSSAQ